MGFTPQTWPRPARDLIRTSNKYLLNPIMLRLAGRRYWYASLLQHTGRRSGKRYATPVVADRIDGHVLVPLPYGTDVDWLRNVLTAGEASLTSAGRTYELSAPEIIDAAEALPLLPSDRRRVYERTGMARFLRAQAATAPPPPTPDR